MELYSDDPAERRDAALGVGRLARRSLRRRAADWPAWSPGSVNAWLLMVTTKPPTWRDSLVLWQEEPLTFGEPHPGFFYPDPLGFWGEVRRWATVLTRLRRPDWGPSEAVSVSALLHLDDQPQRLARARDLMRPRVVLFLDAPSWLAAGLAVRHQPHHVPDPHRSDQVYEGLWAVADDGTVVGKAPQHPATHKLYRAGDMDLFLRSAPLA